MTETGMESEDLINEQAWLIARGVRPLDTADQMAIMARGASGKQLRYKDLVSA